MVGALARTEPNRWHLRSVTAACRCAAPLRLIVMAQASTQPLGLQAQITIQRLMNTLLVVQQRQCSPLQASQASQPALTLWPLLQVQGMHPAASKAILLDLPGLLFFSTYTLLVLFWAEIYHQARSLPTSSLRPAFLGLNAAVYAVQARPASHRSSLGPHCSGLCCPGMAACHTATPPAAALTAELSPVYASGSGDLAGARRLPSGTMQPGVKRPAPSQRAAVTEYG